MQINVETFEAVLRARGIKQADLARKARLGAKTVGRIRRGEDLRRSNVEKIAAALDMPVEALLEPPSADLSERAAKKSGMQRFVIDISSETLNQLWMAHYYYRIPVRALIEWAPLLFSIVAEMSLRERRNKLDAWFEAAEGAISKVPGRHVDEVETLKSDLLDLYWTERSLIDERDLTAGFEGEHTSEYGGGNAFLDKVEVLAAEAGMHLEFFSARIDDIVPFSDDVLHRFGGEQHIFCHGEAYGNLALAALEAEDVFLRDIPDELLAREKLAERVRWLASFYGGAKGDFELALARWRAQVASPDVDSTEPNGGDDEQASA